MAARTAPMMARIKAPTSTQLVAEALVPVIPDMLGIGVGVLSCIAGSLRCRKQRSCSPSHIDPSSRVRAPLADRCASEWAFARVVSIAARGGRRGDPGRHGDSRHLQRDRLALMHPRPRE